jgi:TetR/AcrR family transcriptional regulator
VSFRSDFEHRQALLDAAIRAFVAHGYEGTSLSAVLNEAGVSKGQFYHHFDGKEGLYLGVCEALVDRKRAHFAAHPLPAAADPFDALEEALRAGLAFARAHPDLDAFGRAFLRERGRPIFERALRALPVALDDGLRGAIERGVVEGAFDPAFAPGFAPRAIAVVVGAAGDLLDADDPERGVADVMRFLRRGLAAAH